MLGKWIERSFIKLPGSWRWISSFIIGKMSATNPDVVYWLIESLQNNMVCEPNDLTGFSDLNRLLSKKV